MRRSWMVWGWLVWAAAATAGDFSGTWETSYGVMSLTQKEDAVEGYYDFNNEHGKINGTVQDSKLTFTYSESVENGEGVFDLDPDGRSFTGQWRTSAGGAWMPWTGQRIQSPVDLGFVGLWETNFGRMRLLGDGKRLMGTYSYAGGSSVEGEVEGNRLTFRYQEPTAKGEGRFEMAADGLGFTGQWRPEGTEAWSEWNGTRVQPVAGRTWLVVLEANWESKLSDKEYTWGAMLRSFFARTPWVEVRHRFFTDEASFRRWAAEIPFLAEPVVLVLSTHGDANGLRVDNHTIGVDVLADALRYAGNVKLLHFSACSIFEGSIVDELVKQLRPAANFPISGYATSVDWGASAVLELGYFDLVLGHNRSPAEAAELLPDLMPFAGDKDVKDSPYPSTMFRFQPASNP